MKVTLDLDDLVARGELDAVEAERLRRFAVADTSALGINVFLALGAVAISLGLAALIPTALTAVAIGVVLVAAGLALTLMRESRWSLFAQVCLTIGALALSGGLSFLAGGELWANLAIALGVAVVATVARSGLLVAIAVIAFAASVGAATNYEDSLFWQPALSIALLAVITLVLFVVSLRLSPAYERLAIIGARVAIVMLNVGFLIGSLLGDSALNLPPVAFSVAWAVVLLGAAIWAMRAGRRWVVNAVAVFGAMHFFIQWFMVLGATALSIIGGGILLIGLGFTLAAFNRRRGAEQPA